MTQAREPAEVTAPATTANDRIPRLASRLREIAAISEPGPGVTRLAFTELERQAHALVRSWYAELGLRTWVDSTGNSIAELPGTGPSSLPAIGTGSHLDSVPRGGQFDGIAGVVAAVEVAQVLVDTSLRTRHPLRFIAFAGEEGARFGQACLGSKACAALINEQDLWTLKDQGGTSVAEAMISVGLDPSQIAEAAWRQQDWAGFIELHIEQGATLEERSLPIGLVDIVSGSTRFALNLSGHASHTGATPMDMRADALAAAAEIVLMVEAIAKDPSNQGARGTVGVLNVAPGSITTIPGQVYLTIDIRDVDGDRQRKIASDVIGRARGIASSRRVQLTSTKLGDAAPVTLPASIRQVVAEVCASAGLKYQIMESGASHDCQMINQIVPAALIFVPSHAGLSHVPEEWTSTKDLAAGVEVLIDAIRSLDSILPA